MFFNISCCQVLSKSIKSIKQTKTNRLLTKEVLVAFIFVYLNCLQFLFRSSKMSVTLTKKWCQKFSITVTIKQETDEIPGDFDLQTNIINGGDTANTRFSIDGTRTAQVVQVIKGSDKSWYITFFKESRPVRGTDSQQFWTTWSPTYNDEAFVYIFGQEKSGEILYAHGDVDNDRVRLTPGLEPEPAYTTNDVDSRLFRQKVSLLNQYDVLQHIASGKFVTVENNDANRLILVDNEELASEVIIQFQD